MKTKKSYNFRAMRNYILICLGLILLSCVAFFIKKWNLWVLPISILICSALGTLCMFLLIKTDIQTDVDKKKMMISLILRYVIMAVGLIACGFLIKYTMEDPVEKKRYLIMIISAVPYVGTTLALLLTKK